MPSERITENLVRTLFAALEYAARDSAVTVEEQKSANLSIQRLLRGASKSGGAGIGAPEFIVTSADAPDLVLVVECKASVAHHGSPARNLPVQFAVDGVLHYAAALAREFTVVAVAVSGQTEAEMRVSTFLWPKGQAAYRDLTNRDGVVIDRLVSFVDFQIAAEFDPIVQQVRTNDLMEFSRELHVFMRDQAKLTEAEKPLLVSGTILALRNKAFAHSYGDYKPQDLPAEWLRVVTLELEQADIPKSKKKSMSQPYSSIAVSTALASSTTKYPRGILFALIKMLAERVMPFISVYQDFDVVGAFYGEFLRYTGGDKKGLGIVLTPRHVTELFVKLANVTQKDRVLDPCAGTGGFLIAAMRQMMQEAMTADERENIKQNQLIGIEQQVNMYALAASNMILRGDGKANLYQDDCFNPQIITEVKARHPNIGFVNPPYSQKDSELNELLFVKNMLDMLDQGGIGIAIVPISCATGDSPHKETILKTHTLMAVMSMPTEIFYPVGVVTCIMVFKVGQPHAQSKQKSWFGYWKNDGFIKTKHRGRVDAQGTWPAIRDRWLGEFHNREIHAGRSVAQSVTSKDEWCAEAYMETDYSALTQEDFEEVLRNYAIFSLVTAAENESSPASERTDGLLRGFRTAELVDSSTLPGLAVDNHSGLRWGVGSRALSAGVGCCRTPRCIG